MTAGWLEKRLALKRLWARCPFGYVDGKLITHRATTNEDIVEWLQQMKDAVKAL